MSSNKKFEDTEAGKKQASLFKKDDYEWWKPHWKDMPEFEMDDLAPDSSLKIHFRNKKDRDGFAKLLNQKITSKTKFLWYPKAKVLKYSNKKYIDKKNEP